VLVGLAVLASLSGLLIARLERVDVSRRETEHTPGPWISEEA
jgi:hypothetical protein